MRRRWWVAGFLATALVCGLVLWAMFPYNLQAERDAARKAGIPLTYSEIPWTPVPKTRDAAAWYVEFDRRLFANDFTSAEYAVMDKPTRLMTTRDKAVLRQAFEKRQPMLDALHTAAAMPAYGHPRPAPASTGTLSFHGFALAREAARMLREEGRALATKGQYEEAVRVQAQGYNVANHLYQGHSLIAWLVGVAIEDIASAGLKEALWEAGPNAKVAKAVRRAVHSAPNPNVADYLRADVPGDLQYFREVTSWKQLKGAGGSSRALLPDTFTVQAMSSPLSAAWLHWQRRMILAADQPANRRQEMQAVADDVLRSGPPGPAMWHPREYMTTFAKAGVRDDTCRARKRVLLAATYVMEYRTRTGAWPKRLGEAVKPIPTDPFNGKPLGYRKEANGFVVYSVGESGTFAAKPSPKAYAEAMFRYPAP